MSNILISGGIFCIDAYDLFVINLVMKLMATEYKQSTTQTALISSVALAGAMIGQLLFGFMGDLIGRRKTFMITVVLVITMTLFSAFVFDDEYVGIYNWLAIARFFLGLGIGGEYPLSATVSGENVTANERGKTISKVFAMQGVGSLLSSVIILVLLKLNAPVWFIWRFSLGITALPATIIFYLRYKTAETDRFTKAVLNNNMTKREQFSLLCGDKQTIIALIGAAGTWFVFDIAFYANNLFNATITNAMGLGNSLIDQATNSVYIALMALPGYFLAIWTSNVITRKNLQLLGFIMIAGLYSALGIWLSWFKEHQILMIITYGLTFFFSNFGPNTTTFIVPAEAPQFKTPVRSSSHGISAAAGKLGAVLGTSVLKPLVDNIGLGYVLIICGGLSVLGLLITLLFVPKYDAKDIQTADDGETMEQPAGYQAV